MASLVTFAPDGKNLGNPSTSLKKVPPQSRTPLYIAADHEHLDAVQLLLAHWCCRTPRDFQNLTPEAFALFREREDIARLISGSAGVPE